MVKYQKMPSKPWHALGIEEVFRNLNSNEEGLNREEAGSRLKKFGQNKIVEKNGEKIILILWDQFRKPLIYIFFISHLPSLFFCWIGVCWLGSNEREKKFFKKKKNPRRGKKKNKERGVAELIP